MVNEERTFVDFIRICLIDPDIARTWAERTLPNGKKVGSVKTSDTVHYSTFKPVTDGLFCERIFGPVKDYTCACGTSREIGLENAQGQSQQTTVSIPNTLQKEEKEKIYSFKNGVNNGPPLLLWQKKRFLHELSSTSNNGAGVIGGLTNNFNVMESPKIPLTYKTRENTVFSTKKRNICEKCEVEFTTSYVRRHRLGFIELVSPVAHIWFIKSRPGYMATLLGARPKAISAIAYCQTFFPDSFSTSSRYSSLYSLKPQTLESLTSSLLPLDKIEKKEFFSKRSTQKVKDLPEKIAQKMYYSNQVVSIPTYKKLQTNNVELRSNSKKENKYNGNFNLFLDKQDFFNRKQLIINNPFFNQKFYKKISVKGDINPMTLFPRDSYSQYHNFPVFPSFAQQSSTRLSFLNFLTGQPLHNSGKKRIHKKTKKDIKISIYNGLCREKQVKTIYEFSEKNPSSHAETLQEMLSYTGGGGLQGLLKTINLRKLVEFLKSDLSELSLHIARLLHYEKGLQKAMKACVKRKIIQTRRYKLAKQMLLSGCNPVGMTMSSLPVLPPGLRPIVTLRNGGPISSDLNTLYRKIIFAIRNLKNLAYIDRITTSLAQNAVQQAVDALLDTGGRGANNSTSPRTYKSLSAGLKGKRGRFRQNLLGKRVDYSGRSVIVVGPTLEIHQCGLPYEMAIQLFQPFLIRRLISHGFVKGVYAARRLLKKRNMVRKIWDICREEMRQHPILLNRAPTLHRLGVQAFIPVLVTGRAIYLHPLVCAGFNADFDGDQMAVHVPLSASAVAEAWKLMWSRNNFLSPSNGQPILLPSQDMVVGCYYLTENVLQSYFNVQKNLEKTNVTSYPFQSNVNNLYSHKKSSQNLVYSKAFSQNFSTYRGVISSETRSKLSRNFNNSVQTRVWITLNPNIYYEHDTNKTKSLEFRVTPFGNAIKLQTFEQIKTDFNGISFSSSIRTTIGRILFNQEITN